VETDERVTGPQAPGPPEPRGRGSTAAASPLRVVGVLAGAALAVAGFLVAFDFLRRPNANRAAIVAVALVAGAGGVFLLFW
jgi:hypothetical protein